MQQNVDVDDIERLLAELEGAGGIQQPAAAPAATPSKPGQPQDTDGTPQRTLSSFSTYTPVYEEPAPSPEPAVRPPQKLAPLSAGKPSGLPKMKMKGLRTTPHKEVLAAIPSSTPEGQEEAVAEDEGPVLAPGELQVNMLPMLHIRQPATVGGIAPRPRWGHTLTAVGESLLTFGGVVLDGHGSSSATNDCFELDLLESRWDPAFAAGGVLPPPRAQHAAVGYLGNSLVIIGGSAMTPSAPLMNDVWRYDIVSQQWEQLCALSQDAKSAHPTGRFGHSVVVYDHTAYVFGGKCQRKAGSTKTGLVLSDEVFCFNLERRAWTKRASKHSSKAASGGEASAAGEDDEDAENHPNSKSIALSAPAKRFNHTAALVGATMLIHGGQGSGGEALADTWAFDLIEKTWTLVHNGVDTVPRAMHFSTVINDLFVVVGGSQQLTGSNGPVVAALKLNPDEFGVFHWVPVKHSGEVEVHASRRAYGAAVHDGFVYLHGGLSGAEQPSGSLERFLAMDGVPTAASSERSAAGIMRRLYQSRLMADAEVEIGGHRWPIHKFVLQQRAPRLYEAILGCNKVEEPTAAVSVDTFSAAMQRPPSSTPSLPCYGLEGNVRVKGLPVPIPHHCVTPLLAYLYTGKAPTEESEGGESVVGGLAALAEAYGIAHLTATLAPLQAPEPAPAGSSPVKNRNRSERMRQADEIGAEALRNDVLLLLESGANATAQVLFQDPHTGASSASAVHPAIVIHASDTFRKLLKPVCCDGVQLTKVGDIQAKPGRRGLVVVGAVPIPTLSVRYILRYLYAGELDVSGDAALSVMIAAHTLRLPRLQAYCEAVVARDQVDAATCCDFLTLSKQYGANHLKELCLLTAATNFAEVSISQQYLKSISDGERDEIHRAALMMTGRTVAAAASSQLHTEQRSGQYYEQRFQNTRM